MTVKAMLVLALIGPEVPVTVIVNGPVVAELLAVRVNTLVLLVGFVLNDAVTPFGMPVAARVTLPAKLPTGVTVIVSVTLAPWFSVSDVAEGVRVNPAGGVTVRVMLALAVVVPEVPVMVIG